jgi:hypothetical protein
MRKIALVLAVSASFAASACQRKAGTPAPAFSSDSTPKPIDQPLTLVTAGPLSATTPDPHGLVAATPDPHGLVASILGREAKETSHVPDNPFAGVPLKPSRTPSGRIEWAASFKDGYIEAVERNKAMVVLFGSPGGEWYEKVLASFASPELAALADKAVWIRTDPLKDTMTRNVCTALGVEHTPTLSVLDPNPEMISEELRVEGYEEPAKLARDLDAPLMRANGQLPKVPTKKP